MTRTRTVNDYERAARQFPVFAGDNPYLRLMVERGYVAMPSQLEPYAVSTSATWDSRERRNELVREYSWAIPNGAALDELAKHGPLVEVGAGGGYWAHLLQERGVDVEPTDPQLWLTTEPANPHDQRTWCGVHKLTSTEAIAAFPDRTLFTCWPSRGEGWSDDALAAYTGDVVLYVGEDEWGCTGSGRFHELLQADFRCDVEVEIPTWDGIHDDLSVWRRR